MLHLNHDPGYSGIYQENFFFEENIQDLQDQEEWDNDANIVSADYDAFILPSQDDAQA